ncbi:MAG: hypothetical protein GXP57_07160 [Deltaproteobacteria bacterium]|nr:hypothetical protein [Deltaproteobacteria bacterium]
MVAAAILLPATPALAVQLHGAPEGLYVHMLAHVLYFAALLFLLLTIKKRPPGHSAAWRNFRLALVFFLLWNTDTFVVHWLYSCLPDTAFAGHSLSDYRLTGPLTPVRWIYYLGRFDHLLCVPAMFFLVLSLRRFCREAESRPPTTPGPGS